MESFFLFLLGFVCKLALASVYRFLIYFFFFFFLTICWVVLLNRFQSVGLFADLVSVFMVSLVTKTQVSAYHLMNENKIYGGN